MESWPEAARMMAAVRGWVLLLVLPALLCIVLFSTTSDLSGSYSYGTAYLPLPLKLLATALVLVAMAAEWHAWRRGKPLGLYDDLAVLSMIGAIVLFGEGVPLGMNPVTTNRIGYKHGLWNAQLGLLSYKYAHGCFPPAIVRDADGKPLYSWRVLILPYIDEQALYDEFHKDEPWDSPHNRTLLTRVPATYADNAANSPSWMTRIQGFVGPGAAFEEGKEIRDSDFRHARHATLMLTRGKRPIPWSMPGDIDARWPAVLDQIELTKGGMIGAVTADGMTLYLERDEPNLRAMLSRDYVEEDGKG